jgi:hypothetical protein
MSPSTHPNLNSTKTIDSLRPQKFLKTIMVQILQKKNKSQKKYFRKFAICNHNKTMLLRLKKKKFEAFYELPQDIRFNGRVIQKAILWENLKKIVL